MYVVNEDGKLYENNAFIVDVACLSGWRAFTKTRLSGLARLATALKLKNFTELANYTTAQWWLAMRSARLHKKVEQYIRLFAASNLRFKDWRVATEQTLLDSEMTASRRWNRALPVLQRAGIYYLQQLILFEDEFLLVHVDRLNTPLLMATRHAVEMADS